MPRVLATTGFPCMVVGVFFYTLILDDTKLYLCKNKAGYGEQDRKKVQPKDFRKKIHQLIKEYYDE